MDELRYQVDLLKAMNQKLSGREKMFRLVCDTSNNAFLYYGFEKNEVITLGIWDEFFSFRVKEISDFSRIFDVLEEKYIIPIRNILFLEKTGEERGSEECCLEDGRTWLEFETRVSYDESGKATDKIICIRNITKFKLQNEELRYMA